MPTDLPKHVKVESRSDRWKKENRDRYNLYQKNYMRKVRQRQKDLAQ